MDYNIDHAGPGANDNFVAWMKVHFDVNGDSNPPRPGKLQSIKVQFSPLPKMRTVPETPTEKEETKKWEEPVLRNANVSAFANRDVVKFRSFNDLARITQKTNVEFSIADFQALFLPMIRAWTKNPNFANMTIVNNNWTIDTFHTKLMPTDKANDMPTSPRRLVTTTREAQIPSIIRSIYQDTVGTPGELVMESLRIDFSKPTNKFEVRVYFKRQAFTLDDYPYRCAGTRLGCATRKQLLQTCSHHEHFVVAGGNILLTQVTACDFGNYMKTFSLVQYIQPAPPVQPHEQTCTVLPFDPLRPQKFPGQGPTNRFGEQDWWYDAKHTEVAREIMWRTAEWDEIDRSQEAPLAQWQVLRSNGWGPLHTDPMLLENIELEYMKGRRMLPYRLKYHKPSPDAHQYVIDFGEMHQIDIFFPADVGRQRKVRRTVLSAG